MPMPPSQWLNWRQKSIEWSSASTSVSTVAPVAVKPETDSKYASIGFESCDRPPSRYGSIPKTGTSSQISPTTRKPSRGPTAAPLLGPVIWSSRRPAPAVIAPPTRNGQTGSP